MKLHQNLLFDFIIPSFFISTKVNAVYVSGLKRLFKLDGNLVDSSSFGEHATAQAVPPSAAGHGITFPIDSFGAQSSRQVSEFNGNGKALGSATMLPGGSAPRTIVGWFKMTANDLATGYQNGPFGYGRSLCNNAFYAWLDGNDNMQLDYWCQDEGINPIMHPENNRWYHLALSWDGTNNRSYLDGQFLKKGQPDILPDTKVDDS